MTGPTVSGEVACGKVVNAEEHEILCVTKFGMYGLSHFSHTHGHGTFGHCADYSISYISVLLYPSLGHMRLGIIRQVIKHIEALFLYYMNASNN